ncbi:MAG: phosphoglycerate dehydrogenase [Devosia nanyangense]|uniref:Phosphoglycerate dehydrogenase n=1 Tax=Devosia nanyangense TaxID=1228055 RepID=A0A933L584_9HYPH|nr:phosphoglycerate dehydrogenase [Devosia nanyangense]
MNTILVTPRSLTSGGDPALGALERAGFSLRFGPTGKTPSEADLLELLPGCVGWIAGVEPVSEAVVTAAAPTLKVISRNGVGTDNLPVEVCERLGVDVRRADGANAQGVAELTVALMLASLRQVPFGDAALKRGEWMRRRGTEILGSTVGIFGLGAVGRKVARMAGDLGATVLGHDPFAPPNDLGPNFSLAPPAEIFARAILISLHCPPLPGGVPLIDGAALARMPPGACLVNTARARLVDESAILSALAEDRLACYATDVFDREPPGFSLLLASDRVIATPHIGGFTVQSVANATRLAVGNLLESLGEVSGARSAG